MRNSVWLLLLLQVVFWICPVGGVEPYKLPPPEVVKIIDAPRTPVASLSPTGESMLLVEYEPMVPISYLSQPFLKLAGLRVLTSSNSRRLSVFYKDFSIIRLSDGHATRTSLPEGSGFGFPRWSFDGERIAVHEYEQDHVRLWVVDTRTGNSRAIAKAAINNVFSGGFEWMPGSRSLIAKLVPRRRASPPEPPAFPEGPNIQETSGKFSKVRTYQDLLENAHDEGLFRYYASSQIAIVDVVSGRKKMVGPVGVYSSVSPSPDGNLLLVLRIREPYSHSVPYYYFPVSIEVWDLTGKVVTQIADLPLADEIPMHGVRTGPRSVAWRPLEPATLVWVEALDDGDPERDVPHRDRLMVHSAPFEGQPQEIRRLKDRYAGTDWLSPKGMALVSEYDWKRRWRTTNVVNLDDPESVGAKIVDMSIHDRYKDPGRPVETTRESGERILLQDGDWVYLSGRGGSPQGDRPFLDRMNIRTLEKERIFESGNKNYEVFFGFVDDSREEVVIRYESETEPPNFHVVNTTTGDKRSLTNFEDPAPQLRGIKKEILKYRREDGVELSGLLYLPPTYREGERLPLVIWAYPEEYSDPGVAGQVRGSANRFTFLRGASELFFLTQGYAVLDNAQMPVVGEPRTMNDTFVQQVVASAKAAVDKLDSLGIVDRKRVGVGGHSYGAFMTANLLAHSDLFRAGIARSGAYNRTLTPFGFQSERRTLWEATETYVRLSPFMHADSIDEPLLLVHGEMDSNSGTYPLQSERLFHAMKGHGATARLVMLPHEGHGYRARESVLHVLAEMIEWFDRHVKGR
jgi:dipeptidyl aminopeptidase/acylaminoacyl peptidase